MIFAPMTDRMMSAVTGLVIISSVVTSRYAWIPTEVIASSAVCKGFRCVGI